MPNVLNAAQAAEFDEKGFTYARGLFAPDEVKLLTDAMEKDPAVRGSILDRRDGEGRSTRIALWNRAGDSVYGLAARSERMVDTSAALLGGDVYHYQSKLTAKEPEVGGAWEWHQDYGYWYKNQFMFPDQMMSIMIALTPANKQNGCLQVIKGSHKLGRVNHGFAGEQVGADMTMVNNALKTMELVYCEIEPGDAVFFHSNLLHRSEANLSDHSRWSLISVYSLQSNLAYNEPSGSWKTPVDIVPDEAMLEWEAGSLSDADFLKKENDEALKETGWEN